IRPRQSERLRPRSGADRAPWRLGRRASCGAGGARRQKISRRLSARSIRRDRRFRESAGWRLWRLRDVRNVVLTVATATETYSNAVKSGISEIIALWGAGWGAPGEHQFPA